LESDLQQVAGVEPQDRPAVRRDVADRAQAFPDTARGLQAGGVEEMVDLPRPFALLVDGRDLDLQQEAHGAVARRRKLSRHLALDLRPQAEQARLGRQELGPDLLPPGRMGEVAGSHHRDPLAPRPQRKMLQIRIPACGPGVFGVNVEVSVEAHGMEVRNGKNSTAISLFCPAMTPCPPWLRLSSPGGGSPEGIGFLPEEMSPCTTSSSSAPAPRA